MANKTKRKLICKICGKEMQETALGKAPFAFEVMMRTIPYSIPPEAVRHFECPEKHAGTYLIAKDAFESARAKGYKNPRVLN